MAFRIIMQGGDEKVEVYYEWILKLAIYFQHKPNDNLLTTFFRVGLVLLVNCNYRIEARYLIQAQRICGHL
jgi:hypothetical protein